MKKQGRKVMMWCAAGVLSASGAIAPAWSYKLAVESSEQERRLANIAPRPWWSIKWVDALLARTSISVFAEPVHEEITNRMYGCNGDAEVCSGGEALNAPATRKVGSRNA